jgi:hypothetical protein
MRAGIDVEDCPAFGRMRTADIELDVFQDRLPVNARQVLALPWDDQKRADDVRLTMSSLGQKRSFVPGQPDGCF